MININTKIKSWFIIQLIRTDNTDFTIIIQHIVLNYYYHRNIIRVFILLIFSHITRDHKIF